MALPAILDSVDELPEPIKQHYTQHESGKWLLGVEAKDGWGLENVSGLKSALGKTQEEAKTLKQRMTAFADLDPDAAREAMTKLEELRNAIPEDKVKDRIASLETQLKTKHEKEAKALREQADRLRSQLDHRVRRADALAAIAEAKGNPALLLPVVLQSLRMTEDDDPKTVVVDENGQPRISMKQGSTDPMSVAELVASMREDPRFMQAFEGTSARGSNSDSARPGRGGNQAPAGMQGLERIRWARERQGR